MKLHQQIGIILLLLIFTVKSKAQNINELYFEANTARKLARDGKTDSAITTYENAFKKVDYVPTKYLRKLIELAKLNKDKDRVILYKRQIKTQLKGINRELIKVLDSLVLEDQKVRKDKLFKSVGYSIKCNQDPNCSKNSKRYIQSKLLLKNWSRVDSSNIQILLNLFKQHGFIGEKLVGLRSYHDVHVLLIHFDKDSTNGILSPVLEKALKEGKISPIHYAQIIDRHLFNFNGTQKYWAWPCSNKTEKLQFSEADIPKVKRLRESIGIYDSKFWQEKKRSYWILRNKYNY
jgi:hypothetical protein